MQLRWGLAVVLLGCSTSGTDPVAPSVEPNEAQTPAEKAKAGPCVRTETSDESCLPIAAEECPAGTMPVLGKTSCEPVGVATCAPPFRRDDLGFGCDAALPAECPSGSRIAAGGCVVVGDCDAPFPPSNAQIFVDPSGPIDATHKQTIAAAIEAVTDGGTIAVAAGTYTESLAVTKSLALVGRCPTLVTLAAPIGATAGISISGAVTTTISGITVGGGFVVGIHTLLGTQTTVKNTIVDGSRRIGIYAQSASALTLDDVLIAHTSSEEQEYGRGLAAFSGAKVAVKDTTVHEAFDYGVVVSGSETTLVGQRLVVDRIQAKVSGGESETGIGVNVGSSARVSLDESVIHDTTAGGLVAMSRSQASIARSVVSLSRGIGSSGLRVVGGASLAVDATTLTAHGREAAYIGNSDSRLTISASAIAGAEGDTPLGRGVTVTTGGSLAMSRCSLVRLPGGGVDVKGAAATAVVEHVFARDLDSFYAKVQALDTSYGAAFVVSTDGMLTVQESTVANAQVGVLGILEGHGSFDHVLVRSSMRSRNVPYEFGIGVYTWSGGQLDFTASAIDRIEGLGVDAEEDKTLVTLTSSTVSRTARDVDGMLGLGAVAVDGAKVVLQNTNLASSEGIGLAVARASAYIHGGNVVRNAVGIHAQQETAIVESDAPQPGFTLGVSTTTRFIENGARVGQGNVAIPRDILED